MPRPRKTKEQRATDRLKREPLALAFFDAKGCPFCGAYAEIQPWHGGRRAAWMVACSKAGYECHVGPQVSGPTQKETIARWNTRSGA